VTGGAPGPGTGYSPREIAAALNGLAELTADRLAGGQPPKWVALQAQAGICHIAGLILAGAGDPDPAARAQPGAAQADEISEPAQAAT
jgi:hypothetical protein